MATLADFTSYHLGLMITALEDELRQRPQAPAGPNIRAAATSLLPWDQRFRTCWDDPSFQARYAWLRKSLALDANPTLAATLPQLRTWLLELDPPQETPTPTYNPSELI